MTLRPLCKRAWAAMLSLVHEKIVTSDPCKWSSSRACGIACCATGCQLAVVAEVFAFLHPSEANTVASLMAGVAMLIGGGAVALFSKLKGVNSSAE